MPPRPSSSGSPFTSENRHGCHSPEMNGARVHYERRRDWRTCVWSAGHIKGASSHLKLPKGAGGGGGGWPELIYSCTETEARLSAVSLCSGNFTVHSASPNSCSTEALTTEWLNTFPTQAIWSRVWQCLSYLLPPTCEVWTTQEQGLTCANRRPNVHIE